MSFAESASSDPPLRTILLIGGSLRSGSVTTAVLRTAAALAPDGVRAPIYDRMRELPHFDPDDDREPLHEIVRDLRARLDAADALLLSTPEYAGSLPGAFKNLLDWGVGGGLYDKPVGWINASAHSAAHGAHEALRKVLGYTGSDLVDGACVQVPVSRNAVGADGLIADPQTRSVVSGAMMALVERVTERARRSG